MREKIIAHHLTFCTYGFWLPNDPRGSWSESVFAVALRPFGQATKVNTQHSRARDPHDHRKRLATKDALMFSPVELDGQQALATAHGFRQVVEEIQLAIYACAIMPSHVHLVTGQHDREMVTIIRHLKTRATQQMNVGNIHPFENRRSPWADGYWDVFLHNATEVRRAVDYVNRNPVKDGLKPQHWGFVVPFTE